MSPIRSEREVARIISQMTLEGASANEIGRALGLSRKQVSRWLERLPLKLQPRGGGRCIAVRIAAHHAAVIAALAERAAVPPSTMLARIAAAVLAEGELEASKWLGKVGRPRRPYQRRAA